MQENKSNRISSRNDHARDLYLRFPLHILLAILGDIADCFSANRTVVAGIVTGQPGRKGSMAGSDETRLDWDHFFRETLIMAAF